MVEIIADEPVGNRRLRGYGFDRRVVCRGGYLSPLNKSPKALLEDEMGILQSFSRARRLPDTGAIDRGFRPVAKLPSE